MNTELIDLLRPFERVEHWNSRRELCERMVLAAEVREQSKRAGDVAAAKRADEIQLAAASELVTWEQRHARARAAVEAEAPRLVKHFAPLPDSFIHCNPAERAEAVAVLIGELLAEPPVYVDLDQMAAAVHLSKSSLEKMKSRRKNPLPDPDIEGGGGKKALWDWQRVRPWLEQESGRRLQVTPQRLI